jgi:hypothetical protein
VPGTKQKVPTGLTAAQRTAITESVKSASFDVWSGKADGTLRRLRVAVSFAVPQAARAGIGGLQSGTLAIDLAIGALNQRQTVTGPKSSRPLSELTGALQQATGTGTTTTPTTTAPTTTTPSSGGGTSAAQSKYLDCLQTAGQDLAKVQRCAALLGQ